VHLLVKRNSEVEIKFTPWNISPLHYPKTLRTVYATIRCHIPEEWKPMVMLKLSDFCLYGPNY